jgi:regulator of cell morphogenesis and NO signaling
MENTKKATVGSFVANDYRAASVFQKYGIDFCCRGGISIEEVSQNNKINPDVLLSELNEAVNQPSNDGIDFKTWPLDLLADYIEKTHHRYIVKTVPALNQYLDKLCEVHGENHPELFLITEEFATAANNLAAHMVKEENLLFPTIRQMVAAKHSGEPMVKPAFGTVENPIAVMMQEHDAEGERFRTISELINKYTTPADGCRTYQVAFETLKEFESDLHKHIHLENKILFPKAVLL